MKRASSCTGALALLVLSPLTLAQTPADTAIVPDLTPLVVTGTRTPADTFFAPLIVDTIDRHDPTLATASRVEDILADQPGLHVAGQGRRNGQTLSLRGFGRNGVLVRLDGVRQDINTGHLGNFYLDPALLREVQVARGALSSLYGSNAMGGVVSFETVDAADLLRPGENSGVRLSLRGATANDELGATLSLFGRQELVNGGTLDGLIALGRSNSGDIRRAGGQTTPEDARLDSLLAKGGWQLDDDHRLFVSWQHYAEDATQPPNPQQLVIESELRDRDTTSDNLQLGHRWSPAPDTQVDTRLTLSRQQIEEPAAERTLERLGVQSDGYHRLDHGWLSQSLAFGAEASRATQRPGGTASGFPEADIDSVALYLDDTLTVGRYLDQGGAGEFDLGLGARHDSYSAEDSQGRESDRSRVSPRLRLAWRPTGDLMLYSGYAEAFRAPSLSELYADERHFPGFSRGPFLSPIPDNFWVPNPDLRPETSKSWESGLAWRFGDWGLRASYFDTRAEDFIDTEVDIFAGTTRATNVNRARLWGYDARLDWSPSNTSVTAFLGLAEVSGHDRDSGEPLGSLTPLEALTGLDYHLAGPDLTLGWRGRFARSFDKQGDDEALPGYGLHDVQLAWQFSPLLSASLKLRNVADKEWYRPDGNLGDGRSLLANISLQW